MNKRDIELAEQAGLLGPSSRVGNAHEAAEKFADLIRADEREACAKVCDEARAARLAEQIRARGNT